MVAYTKNHWIVHFEWVNWMARDLYTSKFFFLKKYLECLLKMHIFCTLQVKVNGGRETFQEQRTAQVIFRGQSVW